MQYTVVIILFETNGWGKRTLAGQDTLFGFMVYQPLYVC